jgi:hypothetical protein
MQVFTRRNYQLRSASLETRVAYTGFLLLMVPGVATLIALSVGRMGFSAGAIASYYRGADNEMSFPKTFWQLMEVSHFHLFTIPVVALIVTHLLFATPLAGPARITLTLAIFTGALLDAIGPWSVRYVAAGCAYLLLTGWLLLGAGLGSGVLLALAAMWLPEAWLGGGARDAAGDKGAS